MPEPPLPTHAQDRRRLDALLSRTWALAEEKEHPLGRLQGPRKLQGFKPLNEALAGERTETLRRQVEAYLAGPESPRHGSYGRTARRLAEAVLEALAKEQGSGSTGRGPAPPHVP